MSSRENIRLIARAPLIYDPDLAEIDQNDWVLHDAHFEILKNLEIPGILVVCLI